MGSGGEELLLAPLLQPPARSQLRQPAGARRRCSGRCASGSTWGWTDSASTPFRTSANARAPATRTCPRRTRSSSEIRALLDANYRRPPAARRGQPVAGGRARVLRRGRRVSHGVPLSADAADVHGDRAGGSPPGRRDHAADPGYSRHLPVGDLPAQPRRADARDGHEQGARLHVPHVRVRSAGTDQPRHPAATRPAHGKRSRAHRAHEQPAALDAGLADHLLRRRDRHGRQHLRRRPQWRAHADAMESGPQRRLLARRPAAPVPAADHGSDLRLRGGQRRGAGARPFVAAQLDEAHARGAPELSQAFGRGKLTFLRPGNRKVLAYLREHGDEAILCVANLARSAQPVELDLARFRGRVPVEMLGRTAFPPIGELPYLLTLPAHGFYWFRLASAEQVEAPHWHEERVLRDDLPVLVLFDGWTSFFRDRVVPWRIGMAQKVARAARAGGRCRATSRRSAGTRARARSQARARLADHVPLGGRGGAAGSSRSSTSRAAREPSAYFLPLALAWEDGEEAARARTCARDARQGAPAGERRRAGRRVRR